jgi:hypothetical protein
MPHIIGCAQRRRLYDAFIISCYFRMIEQVVDTTWGTFMNKIVYSFVLLAFLLFSAQPVHARGGGHYGGGGHSSDHYSSHSYSHYSSHHYHSSSHHYSHSYHSSGHVNPNSVYVHGYYRKNGTYVHGYHRTRPNHTKFDNYSTKGNINPWTGKPGTVNP